MSRPRWGPASALAIAMEDGERASVEHFYRHHLAWQFYGTAPPLTWRCPTYTLRRRATYGGRKGRRAILRLKALGCRPLEAP